MQYNFEKYVLSLERFELEEKLFIIRQLKRMPDHFLFGVNFICICFYFLKLKPTKVKLLDKLFTSLQIVKSFEK